MRSRTKRALSAPPIARVFDGCDDSGPWFAPDRALIVDKTEREDLLALLRSGEIIFSSTHLVRDYISGEPHIVHADLRSDGVWIWSDAAAYYLDTHRLSPDPALASHLTSSPRRRALDAREREHVTSALFASFREDKTWPLI